MGAVNHFSGNKAILLLKRHSKGLSKRKEEELNKILGEENHEVMS